MDNFDLKKYLSEGRLFEEDIASKAISVLKNYEGIVEGVGDYIKYLIYTRNDINSSIQAVDEEMNGDNDISDILIQDLEKLSLAENQLIDYLYNKIN